MAIRTHYGDLDSPARYGESIAVDTEAMGLNIKRDRLCLVQLSPGDGSADLIQITPNAKAPVLKRLLTDNARTKIMHFARFDAAILANAFNHDIKPVFCTKIASKLARTYTDRHGLRELVGELVGADLPKYQQKSDWGKPELTAAQKKYAANDVIYLHQIRAKLVEMLNRENRLQLAQQCFDFMPARVQLDLAGWTQDIFSHESN